MPDLAAALCREMRVRTFDLRGGDINLGTVRSSLCLRALNAALGEGCQLRIDKDSLVLRVDPEKLPLHEDDAKRAIRIFTTEIAPEAAAHQAAHWGIFLPDHFDATHPLVLLIHGLDSQRQDLSAIGQALTVDGFQVGYFAYPDDQPIEESGKYFADQMAKLQSRYPAITVNIVAHSMGGLVAREYIEGSDYGGRVDHLILVGTPNGGSAWAAGRVLLEVAEQYHGWKQDPQWRWTWAITDGLGEAGRDLRPHSAFLRHLNARPRRVGVKYTIVAGSQSATSRISAEVADAASRIVPKRAARWWGLRQCTCAIEACGEHFRHQTSKSDGPVTLASAQLAGVADMVVVPADHADLIFPDHGHPPAALGVIVERLGK